MEVVNKVMNKYVEQIKSKLNPDDPGYVLTKKRLNRITESLDDVKYNRVEVASDRMIEESVLF
jgi:hypothetical protein